MNEVLEKVLHVLKDHKGKTISGMTFLGVLSVLKYAKTSGRIEKILGKVANKLQKQMEEKMKEKERKLKMNANFEELYTYFHNLNRGIKRNLKRDIDSIFDIDGLRQSLKMKGISPEERNSLLVEFKTEIFLHAIFSIIYLSISKLILFIRECILNKHEASLEGESEKNLQILENFFSDFSEFIIRNSGKFLYTYLKERLKPVILKLQVNQCYGEIEILQAMNQICEIITEIDESDLGHSEVNNTQNDMETPYGNVTFDEAVGDTTFIDINGIAGLLREEKENERKRSLGRQGHFDKENRKISLKFPQFRIRALRAFTKTTEGQRITENMDYFTRYFYASRDERSTGLTGIAEVEEEEEKFDLRDSKPYQGIKKNGVLVINLEEEEEIKREEELLEANEGENRHGKDEYQNKMLKVMKNASDEFLDLLECGNFNLYGLYAINFEMRKLMNRIMMYFNKKNSQGEQRPLLVSFLPILYKIINEEFIDEDAEENNENFYNTQIKIALGLISNNEAKPEEVYLNCKIMEEFEMKRHVDNGFKEFGKRIFMDKEYNSSQELNKDDASQLERLIGFS